MPEKQQHKPPWRRYSTAVVLHIYIHEKGRPRNRKHRHYRLLLIPNRTTEFKMQVTVGHNVAATIEYLDTNGNPMLTTPTPDSAPTWNNNPQPAGCDTLAAAADGESAEITTAAAGQDTIGVSVTVGGQAYTASLPLTISAAPQQLGSIQINAVAQ